MQLPALPLSDEPALIGVSGGRDSVALLHALVDAGFSQLVVCHLDHSLREESAQDAKFVRKLARGLKLPCVIEREDVAEWAKRRKQSLETSAREARYAFFARVAARRGCARLFLAHHADDQVETFLFSLFRGSGMTGLGGMAPSSTRTIEGIALEIHRPLLGVWREEIDAYIAARDLAFREDASNTDLRHTRNRVRHELLPELAKTFGRDVRQAVWRAAEILRAEDEFVNGLVATWALGPKLAVGLLRVLPLSLQRRQLHVWLRAQGVANVGFKEVERVRSMAHGGKAKVNLPGDWHARRRERCIFLEKQDGPASRRRKENGG